VIQYTFFASRPTILSPEPADETTTVPVIIGEGELLLHAIAEQRAMAITEGFGPPLQRSALEFVCEVSNA